MTTPRIALSALGTTGKLFIEPWGTELTLLPGRRLYLVSEALSRGAVEVNLVAGGLSVCISSDDDVQITTEDGEQIAL